jgi:hypothetical protein
MRSITKQHFEFCSSNLKQPLQEKVVSAYVQIPKPVTVQQVHNKTVGVLGETQRSP